MSDTPPSSVLGSLPSSRPERRSSKRVEMTEAGAGSPPADAIETPAPTGPKTTTSRKASPPERPSRPGTPRPVPPTPSIDLTDVAGTAVRAAGELVAIGLSAAARALKLAVSRLPRP